MIQDYSEWKVEAQESKASISYFSFIFSHLFWNQETTII